MKNRSLSFPESTTDHSANKGGINSDTYPALHVTQALVLEELKKHTLLLEKMQQADDSLCSNAGRKAIHQRLVVTTADIITLLGIQPSYGYKKMNAIKRKLKLPADASLSVEGFCKATNLPPEQVYQVLKNS